MTGTDELTTYEVEACPGCGSTSLTKFERGMYTLQCCEDCSLISGARYGEPDEIYTDGYLFGETSFGLDLTDANFQRCLGFCAQTRLRLIEKVISPPGRFLDVGCGMGEVLVAARANGWETQGVDPVDASARFAREERDLDVRATTLEESGLPEDAYDVVAAFHVLEHMIDGVGFLQTLRRWARPGGYIVVEVPNWRSAHQRLLGQSWPGLRPLEHIAYYSPATLRSTMRNAGLEPVSIRTPTYLWSEHTLRDKLVSLGLIRWQRAARPLGKQGHQFGEPAVVPNAAGQAVLQGAEHVYDWAKIGAVNFGIARVP